MSSLKSSSSVKLKGTFSKRTYELFPALLVVLAVLSSLSLFTIEVNGIKEKSARFESVLHNFVRDFKFSEDFEELKQILLKKEVDVLQKDENDFNFLHFLLFNNNDILEVEFQSIFQFLLKNKFKNVLKATATPDEAPLLHSLAYNIDFSTSTIKMFLDAGFNIHALDKQKKSALNYAVVGKRNISTVEALVEHGMDINHKDMYGGTLLHNAAYLGTVESVDFFLRKGLDVHAVDYEGLTPIFFTVRNFADFETTPAKLQIFKEAEANIFYRNTFNNGTIFSYAMLYGNGPTMDWLLSNGFNANSRDYEGLSPLQCTMMPMGDHLKERVKWMLDRSKAIVKHGGDLSVKYRDGGSLLHLAAKTGTLELVKFYLEKGLDPKARNLNGDTPLHLVQAERFQDKNENVLAKTRAFLEAGAESDARNHQGLVPGDILMNRARSDELSYAEYVAAFQAEYAEIIKEYRKGDSEQQQGDFKIKDEL